MSGALKLDPTETNIWGHSAWRGTLPNLHLRTLEGKAYGAQPYDWRINGKGKNAVSSLETVYRGSARLEALDARSLQWIPDASVELVITDPPYAGNLNYAELADFFYVWLRLILGRKYAAFAPEMTPKAEEIIENSVREKTIADFGTDLTSALSECARKAAADALLVFTFHHAEGRAWEAVLKSVCDGGFELVAAYPVHGEKESSLHLQDKGAIAYDLVHVCRKRPSSGLAERRVWAGLRQEVRRRAREEIRAIEAERYGRGLSPADVNIILIGKCLELYSRHYGAVVDHEGRPFELGEALKEIRSLVDQLVSKDQPLPSELEDIDAESRIYLLALCDRKEIKSDDLHKATRGVLEPKDLIEAGLIIKGRAGRGRTYEVKQPAERFQDLNEKFRLRSVPQGQLFEGGESKAPARTRFVDYVHLLMALAEGGESLAPWLERFRGETPRLRVACDYLSARNKAFAPALKKVRDLLDVGPLFR